MDIAGRRFLPALFTLCVLLTLSFLAAPAAASASAQPIISRRHAAAFKDPSSVPEAQHGASLMSVVTAATTTANPSRRELGDSFGQQVKEGVKDKVEYYQEAGAGMAHLGKTLVVGTKDIMVKEGIPLLHDVGVNLVIPLAKSAAGSISDKVKGLFKKRK
ncbi:unnamed protein product [Closterium sp. NIES-54]